MVKGMICGARVTPAEDDRVRRILQEKTDQALRKIFDPDAKEPEAEPERSYNKPLAQFLEGKWGKHLQPLLASCVFSMENAERGVADWLNTHIHNTERWSPESQPRFFL